VGTWRTALVTAALIAACVPIVLAVEPLREAIAAALRGDGDGVRERLDGAGGAALVLALTLVHTIVWYPAEIIDAAAGFVFGFWPGLALVHAGWIVSGVLAYWVGTWAARPVLRRLAGEERLAGAEAIAERGGITLLLAARLVPVIPFSLFGYAAGAVRVPLWRYAWTTTIGYLPITAISVYLGTRLEDFSITDPVIWLCAGALLVLLLGTRYLRSALRA
jgi:uncharacterized membrane protein YdjX (TVP38/TMEM64 family)